jgi:acetyl esterase/lipase
MDAQTSFAAVVDSSRGAPPPDARIAYGNLPEQFIELRVPHGRGPHPVVMLIHGGCWRAQYDLTHLAGAAEALRAAGFATWTVEYRRVSDTSAGSPGTFDDVRASYDSLMAQAQALGLDRTRVVLAGHSAGGHLALWLASEPGVHVRGIVSLAGITDLTAFASPSGCGAAVPLLLGGTAAEVPAEYTARSPVTRPAARAPVTLVIAHDDQTVPQSQSDAYVSRFPKANVVTVPGGHFDLVAPWSDAWVTAWATVQGLMAR